MRPKTQAFWTQKGFLRWSFWSSISKTSCGWDNKHYALILQNSLGCYEITDSKFCRFLPGFKILFRFFSWIQPCRSDFYLCRWSLFISEAFKWSWENIFFHFLLMCSYADFFQFSLVFYRPFQSDSFHLSKQWFSKCVPQKDSTLLEMPILGPNTGPENPRLWRSLWWVALMPCQFETHDLKRQAVCHPIFLKYFLPSFFFFSSFPET